MDKATMVLKTDSQGSVRTPAHRREALLDEFERSGLPATRFSGLVGVRYQTFATWVQGRKRRRMVHKPRGRNKVRFAEAVLAAQMPQGSDGLVLHLPGGITMQIKDRGQVSLAADLLKALHQSC